jgi:L-2-hydroxyglutarate oxidase LhgO
MIILLKHAVVRHLDTLNGSLRVGPDALNVDLLASRVLRFGLAVSLVEICQLFAVLRQRRRKC